MLRHAIYLIIFCTLAVVSTAHAAANPAQDDNTSIRSQLEKRLPELLRSPEEILFDIETVEGVIKGLKVKATAKVPASASGARGDKQTLDNANRKARADFSTFLDTQVVFVDPGNGIVSLAVKENAGSLPYTTISTSSVREASKAVQRELTPLFQSCEGEGGERICIVELGW